MRPLNEHEKFHLCNDQDINLISKNYEANGYEPDLDLLIVLHESCTDCMFHILQQLWVQRQETM